VAASLWLLPATQGLALKLAQVGDQLLRLEDVLQVEVHGLIAPVLLYGEGVVPDTPAKPVRRGETLAPELAEALGVEPAELVK
jgi:hypothetical protein